MIGKVSGRAETEIIKQFEIEYVSTNTDTSNMGISTKIPVTGYNTITFTAKSGSTRAGHIKLQQPDGTETTGGISIASTSEVEYTVDVTGCTYITVVIFASCSDTSASAKLSNITLS